MALKVCIVSGSRADWGLLRAPALAIRDDPAFALTIVATGSHLSVRHGMTVEDIRRDGFVVDRELAILDGGDDSPAAIRALSRVTTDFGEALRALCPDIVMVLGDRYEILGVVQACLIARVPVAHLCGGDITEGAFDDSIRHAISKMSHLHFVTNAPAGVRLARMGEEPANIVVAGSPSLDSIRTVAPLSRDEVFATLGLAPRAHNILVTFHPPTLDALPGEAQFEELAAALDGLGGDIGLILTGSNADPDGGRLTDMAEAFAAKRANAAFRVSLGQRLYFSTMRHVRAVVGNSSSGLYEAPSFGIATVNIGDRQARRLRGNSVIDVPPQRDAIAAAIDRARREDFTGAVNPYGDGRASERIVARLRKLRRPSDLLRKRFHEEGMP